jgi:hypothetical protein
MPEALGIQCYICIETVTHGASSIQHVAPQQSSRYRAARKK